MAEICGMTPDDITLRWKMLAYPARALTPSWIRAPPESFMPMQGAPLRRAMSMTLQILSDIDSDSEPAVTVKSCAKT